MNKEIKDALAVAYEQDKLQLNYEQFLFYQLYCLKYPLFAGLAYDQQFSLIIEETEKCKNLLYASKGNLYDQIENYLKDCPAISYE